MTITWSRTQGKSELPQGPDELLGEPANADRYVCVILLSWRFVVRIAMLEVALLDGVDGFP